MKELLSRAQDLLFGQWLGWGDQPPMNLSMTVGAHGHHVSGDVSPALDARHQSVNVGMGSVVPADLAGVSPEQILGDPATALHGGVRLLVVGTAQATRRVLALTSINGAHAARLSAPPLQVAVPAPFGRPTSRGASNGLPAVLTGRESLLSHGLQAGEATDAPAQRTAVGAGLLPSRIELRPAGAAADRPSGHLAAAVRALVLRVVALERAVRAAPLFHPTLPLQFATQVQL